MQLRFLASHVEFAVVIAAVVAPVAVVQQLHTPADVAATASPASAVAVVLLVAGHAPAAHFAGHVCVAGDRGRAWAADAADEFVAPGACCLFCILLAAAAGGQSFP